jgi:transcriptional regulator with XRE-family HTH domain
MKSARLQAGKGQREIADALHVTVAAVSNCENDRNAPSMAVAVEFCKQTGVSLDWLILGKEPTSGYDKRIRDLPDALREYVVEALLLAERVQLSAPAKFLRPPTTDTYAEFSKVLTELAKNIGTTKV